MIDLMLMGVLVLIFLIQMGLFVWTRAITVPWLIAKMRGMPILFMQSPTSVFIRVPKKQIHNFYHLNDYEVVVATPHSIKGSVLGVPIGVGDMYSSLVAPEDVIQKFEKDMDAGVKVEKFVESLYKIADGKVDKTEEPIANNTTWFGKQKKGTKDKRIIIYKMIDYSKIKDFIDIGLNPAHLNLQRKSGELTALLKSLKPTDYMKVVMPIVILLVILLAIWMMVGDSGGTTKIIYETVQATTPPRINP
jgi:hypothetical protein